MVKFEWWQKRYGTFGAGQRESVTFGTFVYQPLLFRPSLYIILGLPRWLSGERIRLPKQEPQETWVRSLDREDCLEEKWQNTPVFLPG